MSKKKKVSAPVYEEWSGNEYTDRARENVGTYGDWINQNWENLVTAPTVEDYTDIVNKAYNTTWNDFLDNYNRNANAMAAQNYNRFGGLGSTPSLETQDQYTKQQNDLASRLGSQMYSMADTLAGNQYNRNLQSLGTVQELYDSAGNLITNLDEKNWNIRNQNIEAKYLADVQNAQNSGGWSWGNMLSGAVSGATTGGKVGGGWGALAGGVLGAVGGGLSGYSNTNTSGTGTSNLGSSLGTGIGSLFKTNSSTSGSNTGTNSGWGVNLGNVGNYSLKSNVNFNPLTAKFSWEQ